MGGKSEGYGGRGVSVQGDGDGVWWEGRGRGVVGREGEGCGGKRR